MTEDEKQFWEKQIKKGKMFYGLFWGSLIILFHIGIALRNIFD